MEGGIFDLAAMTATKAITANRSTRVWIVGIIGAPSMARLQAQRRAVEAGRYGCDDRQYGPVAQIAAVCASSPALALAVRTKDGLNIANPAAKR
jgi:hypothetical protein